MNKVQFFSGLSIILLELLGVGVYFLSQQSASFLDTLTVIVLVGGVNLAAVIIMLVGLFEDKK